MKKEKLKKISELQDIVMFSAKNKVMEDKRIKVSQIIKD